MTERLRVREIDDDEGRRLVRVIRRGSGSVVTWRRAQMVLLSAQGMDVPARLRSEMLKTRVAHGYCSRQLAAEACPYAHICEQCENYVTAPEFIPQLRAQLADVTAFRDDAAARGWHTEVARHSRVITSIQGHLKRLTR